MTTPAEVTADCDAQIAVLRTQIGTIDDEIIELVTRRGRLSQQVGTLRMSTGGTRLSLAREQQIMTRFATALGSDGTALAMILLRGGRGRM